MYVADYGNNQILVYDTNLNNILSIPNPPQPAPNGGLNQPEGVAVNNATGNVYVTDTFNNRMQQFTQTGSFIRTWGYRSLDPGDRHELPARRSGSIRRTATST